MAYTTQVLCFKWLTMPKTNWKWKKGTKWSRLMLVWKNSKNKLAITFSVDYYSPALVDSKCILQGAGQKLSTTVGVHRLQKKYFRLYADHFEWADSYMVWFFSVYIQYIYNSNKTLWDMHVTYVYTNIYCLKFASLNLNCIYSSIKIRRYFLSNVFVQYIICVHICCSNYVVNQRKAP